MGLIRDATLCGEDVPHAPGPARWAQVAPSRTHNALSHIREISTDDRVDGRRTTPRPETRPTVIDRLDRRRDVVNNRRGYFTAQICVRELQLDQKSACVLSSARAPGRDRPVVHEHNLAHTDFFSRAAKYRTNQKLPNACHSRRLHRRRPTIAAHTQDARGRLARQRIRCALRSRLSASGLLRCLRPLLLPPVLVHHRRLAGPLGG
jgi:hypothetical protein